MFFGESWPLIVPVLNILFSVDIEAPYSQLQGIFEI
jgi:hypothetical protein